MRRKSSSNPSKKKSETVAHYESILLETMRSDFRAVAEGVQALDERVQAMDERVQAMDERVQAMDERLTGRIDRLEEKVDRESADLRVAIFVMHSDLKSLSTKVERIEGHITRYDTDIALLKQAQSVSPGN